MAADMKLLIFYSYEQLATILAAILDFGAILRYEISI